MNERLPPFADNMEREPRKQAWMISFGDLMALMVTIMVVILATKDLSPVEAAPVPASELSASGAEILADLEQSMATLIAAGAVRETEAGLSVDLERALADPMLTQSLVESVARNLVPVTLDYAFDLPPRSQGRVARQLAWEGGLVDGLALARTLSDAGMGGHIPVSVVAWEAGAPAAALHFRIAEGRS